MNFVLFVVYLFITFGGSTYTCNVYTSFSDSCTADYNWDDLVGPSPYSGFCYRAAKWLYYASAETACASCGENVVLPYLVTYNGSVEAELGYLADELCVVCSSASLKVSVVSTGFQG